MTDLLMKVAAASGGAGNSCDSSSSSLACGNAMLFPRKPPCFVSRGPARSGSAMILLTHILPRALAHANLGELTVPEDVVRFIVERHQNTSGMRAIEKEIAHVVASYSLVKIYGSPRVLGLGSSALDRAFAREVLTHLHAEARDATSQSLMYC